MKLREAFLSEIVLFENLSWKSLNIKNNPFPLFCYFSHDLLSYFYSLLMKEGKETPCLRLLLVCDPAERSPLSIF